MITIPGKIPIHIHPLFWVFAAFISFLNANGSLLVSLLWLVIIFFSILIHEYGHAITAYYFGKKPQITLVAFGGVTSYESTQLSLWRQFFIVLNGPIAGFFLAFFSYLLLYIDAFPQIVTLGLRLLLFVNVFWTIVNLLPVLPLDGGQLLRIVLEALFGVRGIKIALFLGIVLSSILAGFFLLKGLFLLGVIFFLFTFESYQSLRSANKLSSSDKNKELKQKLAEAKQALLEERKQEAIAVFEEIVMLAEQGVMFTEASKYLGLLYYQQGRKKQAYEILASIESSLDPQEMLALHELAYEEQNYLLVAKLSAECFKIFPQVDVALRTARAYGYLGNPKFAGGWLQSANNVQTIPIQTILQEEAFAKVKKEAVFQEFLRKIE